MPITIYQAFLVLLFVHYLVADDDDPRKTEASDAATTTYYTLLEMFDTCTETPMPGEQFALDNLQSFIHVPARTTVGFAPKYTANRKFFANMLSSPAFKATLERDEEELRKDHTRKLRFCCTAIMDQNVLKDLYDREVDQSKL